MNAFHKSTTLFQTRRTNHMKAIAIFTMSILAIASQVAQAVVISSGSFSIGQGFSGNLAWDASEIANNTSPTGDFSLAVNMSSNTFSSGGPKFVNRVLADGGISDGSGDSVNSLATLTANYTGVLPGGATNVQTTLVIDSISIYAGAHSAFAGDAQVQWSETTAGNTGASPEQNLIVNTNFGLLSSYTQLVWNPGEAAASGTNSIRTFVLLADNDRYIDGFEVTGRIELSYTEVPEPASLAGLGLSALLLRRRR